MKYLSLFLIGLMMVSFMFSTIVFAQSETEVISSTPSATVDYQSTNPSDGYQYLFKRLKENVWLAVLSFSSGAKADYYIGLTEVRLAELKYTVDKKDISNLETSSQRYAATAGQATQMIEDKNLTAKKDQLNKRFEQHIQVLKSLQSAFGNDELVAGWRFLEDDINSLKSFIAHLRD